MNFSILPCKYSHLAEQSVNDSDLRFKKLPSLTEKLQPIAELSDSQLIACAFSLLSKLKKISLEKNYLYIFVYKYFKLYHQLYIQTLLRLLLELHCKDLDYHKLHLLNIESN